VPANEIKRTKAEAREALLRRRAVAQAKANQDIEVLNAAAEIRQHQASLDALERMLIRGRAVMLETLQQVLLPHVWLTDEQGWILGHLLAVEPVDLHRAVESGGIAVLALPAALQERWSDLDAQATWTVEYGRALRVIADQADGRMRALCSEALLRETLQSPQ
jgi:Tfp pilus assembly protein PilN